MQTIYIYIEVIIYSNVHFSVNNNLKKKKIIQTNGPVECRYREA